jgi:hypothetical protein
VVALHAVMSASPAVKEAATAAMRFIRRPPQS